MPTSTAIYARFEGTVVDVEYAILGVKMSLLHGTPASGFGTNGAQVHVGDHIYDADSLIPGGGACVPADNCSHLHFEVRQATDTPYSSNPSDSINPESWLAGSICTSVSLSTSPPSPMMAGYPTPGVITASGGSSGCPNARYEFWVQAPGGSWTIAQQYSSSATFNWNTTSLSAGLYSLGVWVMDASDRNSTTYEANVGFNFTLTSGCPLVNVVPLVSSPQRPGASIPVNASTSNGVYPQTCPQPQYKFLIQDTTGAWTTIKNYTPYGSFNYYAAFWSTSGQPMGTYWVGGWVREDGTGSAFDAANSVPFTLAPCSLTISANPTTVPHSNSNGQHVTITGGAACQNPNPLYEFWARWAGSTNWVLLQGYSTSSTYDWNSTGASVGTDYFGVWVKDASSTTSTFDANVSTAVMVT